jgi:hypothetical protein
MGGDSGFGLHASLFGLWKHPLELCCSILVILKAWSQNALVAADATELWNMIRCTGFLQKLNGKCATYLGI